MTKPVGATDRTSVRRFPEKAVKDRTEVNAILDAGLEEQAANRKFFELTEEVRYKDLERGVELAALPHSDYRLTVKVDYNSKFLSSQHANLTHITQFNEDFAKCRTFCFVHELEALYNAGLIKGGDLSNAVVIADRDYSEEELEHLAMVLGKPKVSVSKEIGVLNNVSLHYKNEMARHKLLDMVGDLALVGRPIKAQILAARPGHAANVALAKKIKEYGYFSYSVNEALHLSDKEEMMITGIMKNIDQEYSSSIDPFSQDVMISHIELLLNYCNRFYNRQFITRKTISHDLLLKVEETLDNYFNNAESLKRGLPTVDFLASKINVSTHYLSDMLRNLTGQNAQQHIHLKLIEKSKDFLITTNLSVAEIAYQLGFEYPQSFSKLFKKKTSLTPLEFKNSLN